MKNWQKYLDLKYDVAELKKRLLWMRSQARHQEAMELLKTVQDKPFKYPPIFIIGPPRSGSTLLFQLMVNKFNVSYFQNRMEFHKYSLPLYIKKLDADENHHSDFQSELGKTHAPSGPHEGGYFWRRFYPRQTHDYAAGRLLPDDEFEVINTLKFFQYHFDCPFLSKNMEIALRLRSVQSMFPDAVFVIMNRDPRGTASSLKNARIKQYGSEDVWWSIRPREYENLLKLPYHLQIAYQISYIYQAIHADMQNPEQFLTVNYEEMCDHPEAVLRDLQHNLQAKGVGLEERHVELPDSFSYRQTYDFTKTELADIEAVFRQANLIE